MRPEPQVEDGLPVVPRAVPAGLLQRRGGGTLVDVGEEVTNDEGIDRLEVLLAHARLAHATYAEIIGD